MARCEYCGLPAGVFKKQHVACAEDYETTWRNMVARALATARDGKPADDVVQQVSSIAGTRKSLQGRVAEAVTHGWSAAVEEALEDDLLTPEEETRLATFAEATRLSQDQLNALDAYARLVKASVLRELVEGNNPQRCRLNGPLPFNFLKTEVLIWAFPGTAYFEDRTRRHYEGGSHGVSLRIAKGVYYRVGAFRGYPVDTTETVHVDDGLLAVTDRHLYFSGVQKGFRVEFRKIVSFERYSDGIGIMRDAASAKPQRFLTGDGWFTCNLVANLLERV